MTAAHGQSLGTPKVEEGVVHALWVCLHTSQLTSQAFVRTLSFITIDRVCEEASIEIIATNKFVENASEQFFQQQELKWKELCPDNWAPPSATSPPSEDLEGADTVEAMSWLVFFGACSAFSCKITGTENNADCNCPYHVRNIGTLGGLPKVKLDHTINLARSRAKAFLEETLGKSFELKVLEALTKQGLEYIARMRKNKTRPLAPKAVVRAPAFPLSPKGDCTLAISPYSATPGEVS